MSRSWYSLPAGLPRYDIPPPLSVGPSILTCTSHTPGSPPSPHFPPTSPLLLLLLFLLLFSSSLPPPPSPTRCPDSPPLPTAPATSLSPSPASIPPPLACPPSCTATVLPDIPDPAAHTPLPLAALPTSPPPSPHSAPRTTLPAPLPPPPPPPDIPPTPTLASLTPHNSLALPHTPPPPLPDSALLAPQTIPLSSPPLPLPCSSRSTPSESPSAPPNSEPPENALMPLDSFLQPQPIRRSNGDSDQWSQLQTSPQSIPLPSRAHRDSVSPPV